MLGLKLETDPHWVKIAEEDIEAVLTDHAWCEQKAASNAINLIVGWPQHTELVEAMLRIAQEELSHFEMVHQKINERGFKLGFESKDDYVNKLYQFMRKGHGRNIALIDRLLFAAMIEARSCERFKILSENINDPDLRVFYRELMESEAHHYVTFLEFAKKLGAETENVETRWLQWLAHEAQVVKSYGKESAIHG
jgi:tRNA 2-(methylsulfanyl)-N6-isopentenyladenosine37 hydroxylase